MCTALFPSLRHSFLTLLLAILLVACGEPAESNRVSKSKVVSTQSADHTKRDAPASSIACQGCHQEQYADWEASDHARSMNYPAASTVRGDFDSASFSTGNRTLRFTNRDGKYFIEEYFSGSKATPNKRQYQVRYTFGHYPLQQYLLSTERGKLQAFDVAWDDRAENEGGQRWYELQKDEDKSISSPFNWQNHLSNWNSRCAECHSTEFSKQFSSVSASYQSTFFEVNVGCAACHIDTAEHVQKAQAKQAHTYKSFTRTKPDLYWKFEGRQSIASPSPALNKETSETSADEVDTCAGCHSRRSVHQTGQQYEPQGFFETHTLAMIEPPLYHQDGQIREEVFVAGSFLQSKMAALGVTCSDCHNPHSGKIERSGNKVCTQCHKAEVFDDQSHHGHPLSSAPNSGSACVDCHMRAEIYMGIDSRRDHRFHIPHPKSSQDLGSPLSCIDCHQDKNASWAQSAVDSWREREAEPRAHSSPDNNIATMMKDYRPIIRGSAIQQQSAILSSSVGCEEPSTDYIALRKTLASNLTKWSSENESALLLQAALRSTRSSCLSDRWEQFATFLENSDLWTGSTLFAAFSSIIGDPWQVALSEFSPAMTQRFLKAKEELKAHLEYTQDFAPIQNLLAQICIQEGNLSCAAKHFEIAEKIDPQDLGSMLNYAEFLRIQRSDYDAFKKAKNILSALEAAYPSSADVLFAQGMLAVSEQDYPTATKFFRKAVGDSLAEAYPQHIFTLAVAIENQGGLTEASEILEQALPYHGASEQIAQTLVSYWFKQDRLNDNNNLVAEKSKIILDHENVSPAVKSWLSEELRRRHATTQ